MRILALFCFVLAFHFTDAQTPPLKATANFRDIQVQAGYVNDVLDRGKNLSPGGNGLQNILHIFYVVWQMSEATSGIIPSLVNLHTTV